MNRSFAQVLYVSVGVTLLGGCAGSQPSIPGAMPLSAQILSGSRATIRSLGYKVTPPLLYVANLDGNFPNVGIYRAKAKDPGPLATISAGVNVAISTCIDGNGTLYVTNEPASGPGWISEYPVGKTTPSRIITNGVNTPGFCTIDAGGNLWVANIGGPNVTEYLSGAKKPHTVITKGLVYPIGIAIDRAGNLYVGNGFGASEQNVQVYAPGSKSPTRTITDGVTSPCGLAVDSNKTLYVANEFQGNVAEYRSGQDVPFQTITQPINSPGGVTVDKKGTLYVSDIGNNTVFEFGRGSLTPRKRQISKGLYNPFGIAHYPALLP